MNDADLNRLLLRQLASIRRHYAQAAEAMRGLPISHPGLEVSVLPHGWVRFEVDEAFDGQALLAGVITPWCVNALLLPAVWPLSWPHHTGAEIDVSLPAGDFVMLANEQGFLSLSLLAEPRSLADQAAAEVFVREALCLLAQPQAQAPNEVQSQASVPDAAQRFDQAMNRPVSRRGMLGGH